MLILSSGYNKVAIFLTLSVQKSGTVY